VLDSILELCPDSRSCLTRCADCKIRFLTHPRNAGRLDIRCPFGCRAEHCRREANRRSDRYLATEYGCLQKAERNRQRAKRTAVPVRAEPPPEPQRPEDLGPDMITHIRVVTSIIERRQVSHQETIELIEWVLSQRRMCSRGRGSYGARQTEGKSRGS
jgi:hypothetical protein